VQPRCALHCANLAETCTLSGRSSGRKTIVGCGLDVSLATLQDVAGRPDTFSRPVAGNDAASAPVPPGVRTLIVDDSEVVRTGLTRLLESRPFCDVVGAVSSPEAALEVTRTMHPHVVLQDFSMPGYDAIALVRELSACRPRPRVVMLSAFVDARANRRAVEAGAIGWVLKDSEPEQIFAALLGAAGIRDGSGAMAPHDGRRSLLTAVPAPEPKAEGELEVATPLDARTLWALLRALQGEPLGLTADEVSGRAVIPPAIAGRFLQRLSTRHPPLVAPMDAGTPRAYVLTGAGRLELARLERRIPEAGAHAHGAPPL
jgi:DNA-binding NarL/FixJ family response regulator